MRSDPVAAAADSFVKSKIISQARQLFLCSCSAPIKRRCCRCLEKLEPTYNAQRGQGQLLVQVETSQLAHSECERGCVSQIQVTNKIEVQGQLELFMCFKDF